MTACPGGFIFAENPCRAAPDACLIWQAELDPGALRMAALPASSDHADRFDPDRFRRWFALVTDPAGREHAVLSDGFHHIRIDIEDGSLAAGCPVVLRYALQGVVGATAEMRLAPLRRLIGLYRTGRFLPALFPPDRRVERALTALRVHDALHAGASQRDIAAALFGTERIPADWRTASDSLRSRVRRLIGEARRMAGGGYRRLLRREGDEET